MHLQKCPVKYMLHTQTFTPMSSMTNIYMEYYLVYILNKEPGTGLVSSVRRALTSKLRGPGFKSRPVTVGGPVTIIMWGARLGWKLALS